MHDLKLHIDQIIRFSDQFATFFKDPGLIVAEDWWMAGKTDEPWGRNFVFLKAEEPEAWSLLWNTDMKEFLLLHYVASKGRWFYRFAPDSKEVLKVLKATSTWRAYFGLIDLAHLAAYGTSVLSSGPRALVPRHSFQSSQRRKLQQPWPDQAPDSPARRSGPLRPDAGCH